MLVSLLLLLVNFTALARLKSLEYKDKDPPLFPFPPETGYLNVLPEDNPDKDQN